MPVTQKDVNINSTRTRRNQMAKSGETSPYKANKGGEIASPNTDSVVGSLKRGEGKSLHVNHNRHLFSLNKGARTIETPATDIITRGKKGR